MYFNDIKHVTYSHRIDFFPVVLVSYLVLLNAGWRGRAVGNPSVVLERHNEDLYRLLHQLLPVVREEQVVVRDAEAHWIIGAHHIQQRREQRQSMSTDQDMETMLVYNM